MISLKRRRTPAPSVRERLIYAAKHPVEPDPQPAAERDPDHAGAPLDVAEGDLADSALDPAVRGIVPVVAHHEDAPFLYYEGVRAREDRVLADKDGMLVAGKILDIHPRDHVAVGVCVIGAVLVGVVANLDALLLDAVHVEDVLAHVDVVARQADHALDVVDVRML